MFLCILVLNSAMLQNSLLARYKKCFICYRCVCKALCPQLTAWDNSCDSTGCKASRLSNKRLRDNQVVYRP